MYKNLLIYKQKNGFVVEELKDGKLLAEDTFIGPLPRIDLWEKEPSLWLWLLRNDIFSAKKTETNNEKRNLMLIIRIENKEELRVANRFESSLDFITSLIDKLELELLEEEDTLDASDFMRLSYLEAICHRRKINLYDFFFALEEGILLSFEELKFKKIVTSAGLYHQAIAILANAKGVSYREISRKTGISRENLLTDKSDALKGKRKTLEIRTLFSISQALDISLSAFFVLCEKIQREDLYTNYFLI